MHQSPDLSICIVNWNTSDLLQECLKSIYDQEWSISFEVLVVDNNSSDSSVLMVSTTFPQVKLIANSENVGFARANNQAMAVSVGKAILLLNSDTIVLPDSLDAIYNFLENHPETGAVGCKLLNPDGSIQRSCWRGYPNLTFAFFDAFYLWRLFPKLSFIKSSEIALAELDTDIEVDHLLGACMLVRREVIESVGVMNDTLFLYLEETDWCYRIKKSGWIIHYTPSAQIIHLGQQSSKKNPEINIPEYYRNYIWFYRSTEFPPKVLLWILKLIIAMAVISRIGLWSLRSIAGNQSELAPRVVNGYWQALKILPSI